MEEFLEKHKKDINFFILLLLLVSLAFGLGYLSAKEVAKTPIIIEKIENSQLDS